MFSSFHASPASGALPGFAVNSQHHHIHPREVISPLHIRSIHSHHLPVGLSRRTLFCLKCAERVYSNASRIGHCRSYISALMEMHVHFLMLTFWGLGVGGGICTDHSCFIFRRSGVWILTQGLCSGCDYLLLSIVRCCFLGCVVYLVKPSVSALCSTMWWIWKDLEGSGHERFEVLSWNLTGGNEKHCDFPYRL
jgi:hypothetical protein